MYLSIIITTISALLLRVQAQEETAQDATVFALTYGYPLLAYEKIRILQNVVGVNTWYHFRQLQGAGSVAVVKPNVDTLYSAMVYDLSSNDLVVSIPDDIPPEQFSLISFFDPFGTNFINIGTGNIDLAGNYRVLHSGSVNSTGGNGTDLSIIRDIESPSLYGFVLIRWLLNNTNLEAVHLWQNQTVNQSIPVPSRAPSLANLPTFNKSMPAANNVINLLTAFAPYTLPESNDQAASINASLAAAGITNGKYTAPANVNLSSANSTAVSSISASASAPTALTELNNGWTVANSSLIGYYGDNYAFRAAVADGGYLAIRPPNAIYPSWSNKSSSTPLGGTFQLGVNDAFLFTFSSIPPLTKTGFWSLTAYQNNYLINNIYNVYAITSERSNITYADGSLVYGSTSNSNKTFQVLVQPADVPPPSNWTSNWLPGPAGGGQIQVTLRLYDAEQSLLEGNWQYPVITRQSAITNSTATNTSNTASTSAATSMPTSSITVSTGGAATVAVRFVPLSILTIALIGFQLL